MLKVHRKLILTRMAKIEDVSKRLIICHLMVHEKILPTFAIFTITIKATETRAVVRTVGIDAVSIEITQRHRGRTLVYIYIKRKNTVIFCINVNKCREYSIHFLTRSSVWQPRGKAAILQVNTIEYFLEEFT